MGSIVGIMSDLLIVFSIIVISLVTISVVVYLLPLIVLAALVLLALWSAFLRNRPRSSLVH